MSDDSKRTLTLLIPCYNEEEALPTLFQRLNHLIQNDNSDIVYTLLFVDDGSKDKTRSLIRDYAHKESYVDYIFLSRNFGKEKAMFAGITYTTTDGLIILDADLQDPPELIPEMVNLWRQGYDDVYARRKSRIGESWLKKTTSSLYYSLLQHLSGIDIQRDTGDFRLLDRKCINALKKLDESERNTKALFSWIGFRKIEFLYDRDKRSAGKTKWNYSKLIHLAIDGITSFTTAPLKFATCTGLLVALLAVLYAILVFVKTIVYGIAVPGYASIMIVVLLLGSLQLISLGIIGEYLGRVFTQTKHRPNYLIQEEHFESDHKTSDTTHNNLD